MALLFAAAADRAITWQQLFAQRAPHIDFKIWPDGGDLHDVKYLVAWKPDTDLLAQANALKVVFSLGAGLDHLDLESIPPSVQIVRMVQPGLTDGMVEFATMSVLSVHRHWREYALDQRQRVWNPRRIEPESAHCVGIMGLGVLGEAVARRLATFGFNVRGWSRSRKVIEGVTTFAGDDEQRAFAAGCDTLVCLLPLTDATRGVLCSELFAEMRFGASLVNLGRGEHLVETDLLAALDSGQLDSAVLDVFAIEPLPAEHPFWDHPKIVLTPHIASMTHAESAAEMVIEQIARFESGKPMQHVFDRSRGY